MKNIKLKDQDWDAILEALEAWPSRPMLNHTVGMILRTVTSHKNLSVGDELKARQDQEVGEKETTAKVEEIKKRADLIKAKILIYREDVDN